LTIYLLYSVVWGLYYYEFVRLIILFTLGEEIFAEIKFPPNDSDFTGSKIVSYLINFDNSDIKYKIHDMRDTQTN